MNGGLKVNCLHMAWNPGRYNKFRAERLMPIQDILPLLEIRSNIDIIDLGCGTGTLTEYLAELFPDCSAIGIDSSNEMLEKALERKNENLRFKLQRIEDISGKWDLVFSHSAIQWVEDHKTLIPSLCSCVKPGGQLVVQMPSIYQHPVQILLRDTASEEPFKSLLKGWLRNPDILLLEEYGELLHNHLGEDINVFSKIYPYILNSPDELIEWVYGTSLIPYLERIPTEMHDFFIDSYREKLCRKLGENKVRYFFNRFFLIGKKDAC